MQQGFSVDRGKSSEGNQTVRIPRALSTSYEGKVPFCAGPSITGNTMDFDKIASNITPGRFIFGLISLALAGYFIYPDPQMREVERMKQAEIDRLAEEKRQADLARERQIYEKTEAANNAAIEKAIRKDIRKLVSECRDAIHDLLSKNNSFAVYFPDYSPTDLKQLGDMSVAFRTPLGRPSVALEDHKFSVTQWNIDRIQHPEYPIRSIAMTVEHARDGFSVRRYAATYSCRLNGLSVEKPYQEGFYFMD